jgi:membrane associated rhomboid family serine protease
MHKDFYHFIYQIRYPILLLLILWVVEVIDVYFNLGLSVLGIYPREWTSLPGIFTSPFIHSNWGHVASNSIPILSLTTIMVLFYRKVAYQSFVTIMLGTGLMVWLFARPSYHIGASGMVYGLISFIFWTGIFKKNPKSIILSLIVLTLYSGSVASLFPNVEENISWESHLFGALVGLVVSFVFKSVIEDDEAQYKAPPSWANDNQEKQFFLPRDIFEKTRYQRYLEFLEAERLRIEAQKLQDSQDH